MEIMVEQGVGEGYMFAVSWESREGGLEIGMEVLFQALSGERIPPKGLAIFPQQAYLFSPPGRARELLEKVQTALNQHPRTSGLSVHMQWASPALRDAIMQAEKK